MIHWSGLYFQQFDYDSRATHIMNSNVLYFILFYFNDRTEKLTWELYAAVDSITNGIQVLL
jgi:hypothetical protein